MTLELLDKNVEKEDLDKLLSQFASDKGYSVKEQEVLRYSNFGIANQEGTKLTIFEKGQNRVQPKTVFMVFDQKDYENMTGQKTVSIRKWGRTLC